MNSQEEAVRTKTTMVQKVVRLFEWLLDLYVLDFFIDNQWERLPQSWRESVETIDPEDLGAYLTGAPIKHMLPLSFLSMIKSVQALSIPRENTSQYKPKNNEDYDNFKVGNHPKLKNLFLKHVKIKKRHEISLMANIVSETAKKCNCRAVLDFGSGLGHLVRVLGYKHDLFAVGIECQSQLTEAARELDLELEYTAKKHLTEETMSKLKRPMHFNMTLTSHEQLLRLPLADNITEYGLIGLHPCGDLAPLLLKHFVNCSKVKYICVVGCCYMKLTCDSEPYGYPMSAHLKKFGSKLSYTSREIACHAIEQYSERLRCGQYEDLKLLRGRVGASGRGAGRAQREGGARERARVAARAARVLAAAGARAARRDARAARQAALRARTRSYLRDTSRVRSENISSESYNNR